MLRPFLVTAAATIAVALSGAAGPVAPAARWDALEPGLEVTELAGPAGTTGDGKITVVRIDPARFDLRLLNASAPGEGTLRTAKGWATRAGAVAAINASMYQGDYRTSTGLMRTRAHVNQARVSREKAVLAFDALAPGVPPVRMIDRSCEDLEKIAKGYGTLIQSIRMISCDRKNVWAPSDRRFSTAAIGVDGKGRVLFIHARSPWRVYDLVNALLALPLDLRQAMYVEGGPEAQLWAGAGGREIERVGGFESAFGEATDNRDAWPIPNAIAAVRRPRR